MALDFLILYEHTVTRRVERYFCTNSKLKRRSHGERSASCWTKHLRLFGKDKPEVLVASCVIANNEAINSHVQQY